MSIMTSSNCSSNLVLAAQRTKFGFLTNVTNFYDLSRVETGNYADKLQVTSLKAGNEYSLCVGNQIVSLLRSLPGISLVAILARFSSSLPPLFASGRFATFLYAGGRP